MSSVHRQPGWYFQDDSCSGGKRYESDVQTCYHCQKVIRQYSWRQEVGYCVKCDAPVCDPCLERLKTHGCEPFLKKFLALLEDKYRADQNAKILGV